MIVKIREVKVLLDVCNFETNPKFENDLSKGKCTNFTIKKIRLNLYILFHYRIK